MTVLRVNLTSKLRSSSTHTLQLQTREQIYRMLFDAQLRAKTCQSIAQALLLEDRKLAATAESESERELTNDRRAVESIVVTMTLSASVSHVNVPSMTASVVVLRPVVRLMRLRFLEAWQATVGGAYSTLAYTHRSVLTRRKPEWASTARFYAARQYALARASGDGELQFKCCVWMAYAEAYDWRFAVARRWLRALRRLLRHNAEARAMVDEHDAAILDEMCRHALRYCYAEESRVRKLNDAASDDE